MDYLQKRDISAGVFGVKGAVASKVKNVIDAVPPGTLSHMFQTMGDQMGKYLEDNQVTNNVNIRVDFDANNGTFDVIAGETRFQIMNIGTDTLLDLDNQLVDQKHEGKGITGDPSQLVLLFFQVFSMLVYEIVVAIIALEEMNFLLTKIQNTVNHMVILMFLFTKPVKDKECHWRNLFTKLYSKMQPLLNSEQQTTEMITQFGTLLADAPCPSSTFPKTFNGLTIKDTNLKMFADAIMIKLGEGTAKLGSNEALNIILRDATLAADERFEEGKRIAMITHLGNVYHDVSSLMIAVRQSIDTIGAKEDLVYLREQTRKLLSEATTNKDVAKNDSKKEAVRLAAIVSGTNLFSLATQHIVATETFEKNLYKCHLVIQMFKARKVTDEESNEPYKRLVQNVDEKYQDADFTTLLTSIKRTAVQKKNAVNGELEIKRVGKSIEKDDDEVDDDSSPGFFANLGALSWTTDAWSSAPMHRHVGGAGSSQALPAPGEFGARINYFLQNAYVRAERLYRSFPVQVFLQGGPERMESEFYPMFRVLFTNGMPWVDKCRIACSDSDTRKDSIATEDFTTEARVSYLTISKYMQKLNTIGPHFTKLSKIVVVLNGPPHITPSPLRTILFLNLNDGKTANKRYNLTQKKDWSTEAFATMNFAPVAPYEPPLNTTPKANQETEDAKGNGSKASITLGPLALVATGNLFSEKIAAISLVIDDHVKALVHTPYIIMGYGASGSGKTTALFGLETEPTIMKGLLQSIVDKLPPVELPDVEEQGVPRAPEKKTEQCNFCLVTVKEYYAYRFIGAAETSNNKYAETVKKMQANEKKNHGNSMIMDQLEILLRNETAENTSRTVLTPKTFSFHLKSGEWTLHKGDNSVKAKEPVPGEVPFRAETRMIPILKDCVESGEVHVSGRQRRVATTFMNPASSRSHVIMTLDFSYRDLATEHPQAIVALTSLHIADFAGVEYLPECNATDGWTYVNYRKKLSDGTPGPMPYKMYPDGPDDNSIKIAAMNQYTRKMSGGGFVPQMDVLFKTVNDIKENNFSATAPITLMPMVDKKSDVWSITLFVYDEFHIRSSGKQAYDQSIAEHVAREALVTFSSRERKLFLKGDEVDKNPTLMEVMIAVAGETEPLKTGEKSLFNSADDWNEQKGRLGEGRQTEPASDRSPVKDANVKAFQKINAKLLGFIKDLSRGRTTEPDEILTWMRGQFNAPSRSQAQATYNKLVFSEISKWANSAKDDFLSQRSSDYANDHGASICRFRVAEGVMINESLKQIRGVFSEAYGQALGGSATATVVMVKQDKQQCSVLNNPFYGTNIHNLRIASAASATLTPVAEDVKKIIEKSDGIKKQTNALILGVFNLNPDRDNPPYLDFVPCSSLIQEYKRLSESPLKSACEYEPTSVHGSVLSKTPDPKIIHNYLQDIMAAKARAEYDGRSYSAISKEITLTDQIQNSPDANTSVTLLRELIGVRNDQNANTSIGTLEFLDQACKMFSTDQTFVWPPPEG